MLSKYILHSLVLIIFRFESLNSIFTVPEILETATQISKSKNPDLNIAKLELEQSKKDVNIAQSDLAPTAGLTFERTYDDDLSETYDEREKDVMKATVSWPFFSGGKNIASVKKNKNLRARKELLLSNQIKTNQTNVASAWSNFQSSKGLLNSVQLQVKAAEIASEGVKAEYERGSGRTTLEVIQSNTLLLDAKISLANAERNYLLSQYSLLKSIGLLPKALSTFWAISYAYNFCRPDSSKAASYFWVVTSGYKSVQTKKPPGLKTRFTFDRNFGKSG